MNKLSLSYISHIRKQLRLDDFELQLFMHYTALSIETLKRRYLRARSGTSKLLIKTAIDYKEAEVFPKGKEKNFDGREVK